MKGSFPSPPVSAPVLPSARQSGLENVAFALLKSGSWDAAIWDTSTGVRSFKESQYLALLHFLPLAPSLETYLQGAREVSPEDLLGLNSHQVLLIQVRDDLPGGIRAQAFRSLEPALEVWGSLIGAYDPDFLGHAARVYDIFQSAPSKEEEWVRSYLDLKLRRLREAHRAKQGPSPEGAAP